MPERQRAYRGEELVTVLKGKIGKRGRVTIRNSYGFLEEVSGKDLQALPESDKRAKMHYGNDV